MSKPREFWIDPVSLKLFGGSDQLESMDAWNKPVEDDCIHVREVLPDTVTVPRELMERIRGWVLSYAILTEREGAANCVAEMNHLLRAFDEAQKQEGE